jgi:hypothetical protein
MEIHHGVLYYETPFNDIKYFETKLRYNYRREDIRLMKNIHTLYIDQSSKESYHSFMDFKDNLNIHKLKIIRKYGLKSQ